MRALLPAALLVAAAWLAAAPAAACPSQAPVGCSVNADLEGLVTVPAVAAGVDCTADPDNATSCDWRLPTCDPLLPFLLCAGGWAEASVPAAQACAQAEDPVGCSAVACTADLPTSRCHNAFAGLGLRSRA